MIKAVEEWSACLERSYLFYEPDEIDEDLTHTAARRPAGHRGRCGGQHHRQAASTFQSEVRSSHRLRVMLEITQQL